MKISHSHHAHANTTAARSRCRKQMTDLLKECQAMYMSASSYKSDVEEQDQSWDEYEGRVDYLAMMYGIDFSAALELVENGPIV